MPSLPLPCASVPAQYRRDSGVAADVAFLCAASGADQDADDDPLGLGGIVFCSDDEDEADDDAADDDAAGEEELGDELDNVDDAARAPAPSEEAMPPRPAALHPPAAAAFAVSPTLEGASRERVVRVVHEPPPATALPAPALLPAPQQKVSPARSALRRKPGEEQEGQQQKPLVPRLLESPPPAAAPRPKWQGCSSSLAKKGRAWVALQRERERREREMAQEVRKHEAKEEEETASSVQKLAAVCDGRIVRGAGSPPRKPDLKFSRSQDTVDRILNSSVP